ncbi:hypothetical protein RUM43_000818 [Polyplax serrata]|uniref:Uncharacterized protein n=1 Tax=Polyplax serrata TaxID=468196 RepID=A0AAN8SGW1_POLSC
MHDLCHEFFFPSLSLKILTDRVLIRKKGVTGFVFTCAETKPGAKKPLSHGWHVFPLAHLSSNMPRSHTRGYLGSVTSLQGLKVGWTRYFL